MFDEFTMERRHAEIEDIENMPETISIWMEWYGYNKPKEETQDGS